MDTTTKILVGVGAAATLAVGAITVSPNEEIELTNPQILTWIKPTTDAEWADDVKKENFDIKSTRVLQVMAETHTAKLAREQQAFKKYQECPQCIYYEFYEVFINEGYTEAAAVAEATKQRDEAIAQRRLSIEKLQQSIERMNNELRLRRSGYVVVEGTKTLLPVAPERIRHIHD